MAGRDKAFGRCDLVTREEAEKVLGESVTSVVSGDGFCTYLSEDPVFVAASNEYESTDKATRKMLNDRRRREAEGKTVTSVAGFGESALRAVTDKSIELSVLDGTRVVEVAVAGDGVDAARFEKRIGALMKTLLSRRSL